MTRSSRRPARRFGHFSQRAEIRKPELFQWLERRGWRRRAEQPDSSHTVFEKVWENIRGREEVNGRGKPHRAILPVAVHGSKVRRDVRAQVESMAFAADYAAAKRKAAAAENHAAAEEAAGLQKVLLRKFARRLRALQAAELEKKSEPRGAVRQDEEEIVLAVNKQKQTLQRKESEKREQGLLILKKFIAETKQLLSLGRPDLAILHMKQAVAPEKSDATAEAVRYWKDEPELFLDSVFLMLMAFHEVVARDAEEVGGFWSERTKVRRSGYNY